MTDMITARVVAQQLGTMETSKQNLPGASMLIQADQLPIWLRWLPSMQTTCATSYGLRPSEIVWHICEQPAATLGD